MDLSDDEEDFLYSQDENLEWTFIKYQLYFVLFVFVLLWITVILVRFLFF